MRLPTEPKKGESIAHKVSEIIRYLRASTVRSVVGGKLIGSASGQVIEIPSRRGGGSSSANGHSWKILVDSDLKLTVGFGACTAERLIDSHPTFPEVRVYFVAATPTYLRGDPWNPEGTVGEFTCAVDTTYGVWLAVDRSAQEAEAGFGGSDYDGLNSLPLGPTAEILVDSTNHGPGYWSGGGTTPAFDEEVAYIFLGRVAIDAEGVVTITQHRKHDIVLPALAYPYGINFPA